MNYYAPMSHPHHMEEPPQSFAPNRFIYVKQSFFNPPKVLVNPHFKQKVYVNPQFNPPKIHVNPNFVPKPEPATVISTRNKLVRVSAEDKSARKRRNSFHTKYKIVRDKFKLDKSIKKRYVYVNRFLSMNVVAKNVLLKKNPSLAKPGFVNINGILYRKSPNSLKKAESKSPNARRSLVKRYKLIRAKKAKVATPSKLKKCNIPCPIYRKFGKCRGKETGSCFKLHNPDQIVLCTRFLQGACLDEKCLLSHKVSHEKMPTCKYFLDGLCSKDNCQYLHVKISPKADICRDFLEGFCKKGAQCEKRHQFLCPDFEKNGACPKRRCPYPHGGSVRNSKVLNSLAKKCSTAKRREKKAKPETTDRYYKENDLAESDNPVVGGVCKSRRPKLGNLPAFIPLFETT